MGFMQDGGKAADLFFIVDDAAGAVHHLRHDATVVRVTVEGARARLRQHAPFDLPGRDGAEAGGPERRAR
jgi:hypothetical protein